MEHPLCATSDTTKRYDGTAIRYGGARGETRQGARRPCDVFVKRCRVGTKETRFSGCPRGSITGGGGGGSGREVTDKRESYKMGCATSERDEGRGRGGTTCARDGVARRCPWGTPKVRKPGGRACQRHFAALEVATG